MKNNWLFTILLVVILVSIPGEFVWLGVMSHHQAAGPNQPPPPAFDLRSQQKYEAVMQARTLQPLDPRYQPVMLFCNEIFLGLGTMVDVNGESLVLTCSHLFPQDQPASVYTCHQLFGSQDSDQGICELILLPVIDQASPTPGLALCRLGPAKLLSGCDSKPFGLMKGESIMKRLKEPYSFQSLVTGKRFEALGVTQNIRGEEGLLFGYQTITDDGHGDSGGAFVDDQGDLVILDGILSDLKALDGQLALPSDQVLAFGYLISPGKIHIH